MAQYYEHINITTNDINEAVNPFDLPLWTLPVVTIAKFLLEEIVSGLIIQIFTWVNFPRMPSRVPKPIGKGLEHLEMKDYWYLLINQGVEAVFLLNLMKYGLTLPMNLDELNIMNSFVAVYVIFLLDDFFYYFLHRALHIPLIYPYIHKHHHRQSLPYRGYLDAANESPIEQVLGLGCVWISVKIVTATFGLHALSCFIFFAIFAFFAMLNHTPFDFQLGFLGLNYTTRAHETHHRLLRCNYAQNTMLWDYIFGTFEDYPQRKGLE